jgi:hypothetical protein
LFCNGDETCVAGACLPGANPCPGQGCDDVLDICADARMEAGVVVADDLGVTVILTHTYVNPVVVCSSQYANNSIPVVTRVSNVTATSFDLRLQNPSGNGLLAENVSYVVVEEGTWVIDGVAIEAQTFNSTVTDYRYSWIGTNLSYGQAYSAPVVLGQVMSENDSDWSVFWSRGVDRFEAPTPAILGAGLNVGEDPDRLRASETIGVIVVEAGSGTIGGVDFEADLTPLVVEGVDDNPPYTVSFGAPFTAAPQIAVTTMAGVMGSNGGWAQLHGGSPLTSTTMDLSIDEDQTADVERGHIPEHVSYFVFDLPMAFP